MRIRFQSTPGGPRGRGVVPGNQLRVVEILATYTGGTLQNGKERDQNPKRTMAKRMNQSMNRKGEQ